MLDLSISLLLLGSILGFGAVLIVAFLLFRQMSKNQAEVYKAAMSEMRAVTQRALVLRGLNPHVVDPNAFGPSGMAREDEAKLAQNASEARNVALDDEEQALREAEALYQKLHGELEVAGLGLKRRPT